MTAALASLIMGIIAAVGTATSAGISAKKANDAKKELAVSQAKSDRTFDELYYQDIMKRSDTQNLVNKFEQNQKKENDRAEASNLINGATPEVAVAQKQASANAMAGMISDITGKAAELKDNYKLRKAEGAQAYGQQLAGITSNEAKQWGQTAQNFGQQMFDSFGSAAKSKWGGTTNVDNSNNSPEKTKTGEVITKEG